MIPNEIIKQLKLPTAGGYARNLQFPRLVVSDMIDLNTGSPS
jgi:hypothetical protein